MQLLASTRTNARRGEPKRLRLFTITTWLTRHSRAIVLTLNQKSPWAALALQVLTALGAANTPRLSTPTALITHNQDEHPRALDPAPTPGRPRTKVRPEYQNQRRERPQSPARTQRSINGLSK